MVLIFVFLVVFVLFFFDWLLLKRFVFKFKSIGLIGGILRILLLFLLSNFIELIELVFLIGFLM